MELSQKQLENAFNEWMRIYTEEPEKFNKDWQQVVEYLDEVKNGEEPSYGRECTAWLLSLVKSENS